MYYHYNQGRKDYFSKDCCLNEQNQVNRYFTKFSLYRIYSFADHIVNIYKYLLNPSLWVQRKQ